MDIQNKRIPEGEFQALRKEALPHSFSVAIVN